MTQFRKKLVALPSSAIPIIKPPPEPIELHRPTDEQLRESIKSAYDARVEGVMLRMSPADLIALLEELVEHRGKKQNGN